MEKLRIKYITDKQTIDSDSIEEFVLMTNRRKLRETQVNKIRKMILNEQHFDSPMIVNESEGKKRILDGQHRITAINQIIKQNPNFQIEVMLIKYQDLTPEEEKEIFTRWNSGTRQNTEDFITMHLDDIKIYDLMKDFPVEITIYKGKNGNYPFRNMIEPYFFAKEKHIGNTLGPSKFVEEAKKFNEEDYKWLKKFAEEFKEHAGGFENNIFCRIGGLSPIMFLYMNGDLKPKVFWERFQKVKKDKRIKELVFIGGFAAKTKIKELIIKKMGITKVDERVILKGPISPFTEEHIDWLRKNWPKTVWNIDDLTEEFNEKFGTETVPAALRYILSQHKIHKDPKFRKGRGTVWTKDVMDYLRELSKTMTIFQAHEELQKKFEHHFSKQSMFAACKKENIEFQKQGIDIKKIPKEQIDLIKKYSNKEEFEIESIVIEQLGIKPEKGVIKCVLRSIPGKKHIEKQEKLPRAFDLDEDDENIY